MAGIHNTSVTQYLTFPKYLHTVTDKSTDKSLYLIYPLPNELFCLKEYWEKSRAVSPQTGPLII